MTRDRRSGYDKFDVTRSVQESPVAMPHEALHDELTSTLQVVKRPSFVGRP